MFLKVFLNGYKWDEIRLGEGNRTKSDNIFAHIQTIEFLESESMLEPEVLEELERTLEEIRERSVEGTAVIVEGKKDEKALRELGVEGPIHRIPSGGKTPLNSLEDLPKYEEVIILTDFDLPGEELADFCEKHLEKLGTTVLSNLRDELRNYVRKGVKDIEGLASFLQSERTSRTKDNPEFDQNFQNPG